MQNSWLSNTNFRRMYEVVSAINTLTIHLQLKEENIDDAQDSLTISNAQLVILGFVDTLNNLIRSRYETDNLIVGVNPKLAAFVEDNLISSRKGVGYSQLIQSIAELLRENSKSDKEKLILYLEQLRSLIEEKTLNDVRNMLGDV